MNERIRDVAIDSTIYSFSSYQQLLIKSRLFLYREGLSVGRKKHAWAKIASEISNLPDAPYLNGEEKSKILLRYRQYVLTESRRGKVDKITETDIKDANFYISDDTLQRWFEGQTLRGKAEGKKPYLPSPQKIAAIRDFLLVNNHLHESELEAREPSIALAFVLNDLNMNNSNLDMPEFFSTYRSYAVRGNQFVASVLNFIAIENAGYLKFINEIWYFQMHEFTTLQTALDQMTPANLDEEVTRMGWIAYGTRPSLISFFQSDSDQQSPLGIEHLNLTSAQNNQVIHFDFHPLHSYQKNNEHVLPIKSQSPATPFAQSDYEHFFAFFEEKLYTEISNANIRGSNYAPGFFQKNNSVEEFLYSDEDLKSGKALYDEIGKVRNKCRDPYNEEAIDYDAPVQLIQQGVNVNYSEPGTTWTTLHRAAQSGLIATLNALMEREDLNYLVRCSKGMLPSDWSFRSGSKTMGMKLAEKQAEQARNMGIDLGKFLAQPLPQPEENTPSFDL